MEPRTYLLRNKTARASACRVAYLHTAFNQILNKTQKKSARIGKLCSSMLFALWHPGKKATHAPHSGRTRPDNPATAEAPFCAAHTAVAASASASALKKGFSGSETRCRMGGVRPHFASAALVLGTSLLLLPSCKKTSEKEREARAAQFTTSTKPAPNPQKEDLETLVRRDKSAPTTLHGGPKFELYSDYTGEDIRQVTGVSGRSLLLCFTAPWCPHSTRMRQSLQQLAKAEKGRVQVVEVNADAHPALAEQFGLNKVPTTVFYTEGVKLRTIEGAYTAESLQKFLHSLLSRTDEQQP